MYGYPGYGQFGYGDGWIWAILIVLLILFLLWGNNGCYGNRGCGCMNCNNGNRCNN